MIEFDEVAFGKQMDKQEHLFKIGQQIYDDPLVKEAVKQFIRGVVVSIGVAFVKHAFYQYKLYRAQKHDLSVEEVIDKVAAMV